MTRCQVAQGNQNKMAKLPRTSLKKRAGHGRWRERNERKQLDLHVHTRGESKDSSTT